MLPEFSDITPATVAAETETAIAEASRLIDALVAPTAPLTFDARVVPLDRMADVVGSAFARTGFMGYVHPDPEVRAAGRNAEERMSKWSLEIGFRPDVYQAVKTYAETADAGSLQGEERRLLEFTLRDFVKAGHELAPEAKAALETLTNRLVELTVAFEKNIADDARTVEVTVDQLEGLPEGFTDSLEDLGEGRYRLTMAYPHVIPVLDNAVDRELRRRVSFEFNNKAVEGNRTILAEAVEVRRKIARLFDRSSWAHHRLDERMAKNPERVEEFYAEIIPPLTEAGRRDIEVMAGLLRQDGYDDQVRSYDWRYYDNLVRRTEYGVDQGFVAQHLPLGQVVEGMLAITAEVFGLRYRRVEAPTWHPDVEVHAIFGATGDDPIAHFYMDLFPREGKFGHAAAFPLVVGRQNSDGTYQRPVSAIVANFTKPTADRPSLLRHSEVETLFHEFGHILHQTLTKVGTTRFAGTNTETDFVEAPSQIMQHWVWQPDVLGRFARHHQTGEPLPTEVVERMVAARRLNVAVAKLRQVIFGKLDLLFHGPEGDGLSDDQIMRRATEYGLFPFEEGTFFPAGFGHLMGGYDAGYYGYLWSEVYGDDMFSRFEAEGHLNPVVGADYRRDILERGGTVDGLDLVADFLGRQPNSQAFLRNLGIG